MRNFVVVNTFSLPIAIGQFNYFIDCLGLKLKSYSFLTRFCVSFVVTCINRKNEMDIIISYLITSTDAGRTVIRGNIHIFVLTASKNNRFQKKLIRQNTNI